MSWYERDPEYQHPRLMRICIWFGLVEDSDPRLIDEETRAAQGRELSALVNLLGMAALSLISILASFLS